MTNCRLCLAAAPAQGSTESTEKTTDPPIWRTDGLVLLPDHGRYL